MNVDINYRFWAALFGGAVSEITHHGLAERANGARMGMWGGCGGVFDVWMRDRMDVGENWFSGCEGRGVGQVGTD